MCSEPGFLACSVLILYNKWVFTRILKKQGNQQVTFCLFPYTPYHIYVCIMQHIWCNTVVNLAACMCFVMYSWKKRNRKSKTSFLRFFSLHCLSTNKVNRETCSLSSLSSCRFPYFPFFYSVCLVNLRCACESCMHAKFFYHMCIAFFPSLHLIKKCLLICV